MDLHKSSLAYWPAEYGGVMVRFEEQFLHIDMDAFFVEVERKRDSSLVGVPVIVGGLGRRGVVASASYEARAYGVRSAMPIGEARRLCPHGRYVPPSHGIYGETSREVFAVFRSFTPLVEGLSVDEAFLDIAGLRLHYASPADAGHELRRQIRQELGLPASVGISAVKFISKLASDASKPNGLLVVPAGDELEFLHPMPVRRLWGVGEATRATLEALGIETVGDLAAAPESLLAKRLGPSLAQHLTQLAAAIDPRAVEPGGGAKSVSVEETYETDLDDEAEIQRALLRLCNRLSLRLHRSGLAGHTVSLKVRFGDFETVARSETVHDPIDHTPALWDQAQALLQRVGIGGRGVRLLGIGVSGLVDAEAPRQLSLDSSDRSIAAGVVEEVRERFGDDAVLPASLIADDSEKRRDG
jgi:DNA polymerase-4